MKWYQTDRPVDHNRSSKKVFLWAHAGKNAPHSWPRPPNEPQRPRNRVCFAICKVSFGPVVKIHRVHTIASRHHIRVYTNERLECNFCLNVPNAMWIIVECTRLPVRVHNKKKRSTRFLWLAPRIFREALTQSGYEMSTQTVRLVLLFFCSCCADVLVLARGLETIWNKVGPCDDDDDILINVFKYIEWDWAGWFSIDGHTKWGFLDDGEQTNSCIFLRDEKNALVATFSSLIFRFFIVLFVFVMMVSAAY